MSKDFSPLLASPAPDDLSQLVFPVWASPKLDGIRAVVLNGQIVSRSLKPIPNVELSSRYSHQTFEGLDGELICGNPTAKDVFQKSTSAVMGRKNNSADVKFYVFDHVTNQPYESRKVKVESICKRFGHIVVVEQVFIENIVDLMKFEAKMVDQGYEGIMLRGAGSSYKYGRSTPKEAILLKVKRFEHNEAKVLGTTELMHNANEAVRGKTGHMERSSKKDGLKGTGKMGALKVIGLNGIYKGVEFEIGTGFTEAQRKETWKIGEIVRYKHQPSGAKDKPRFPVFDGRRSKGDM